MQTISIRKNTLLPNEKTPGPAYRPKRKHLEIVFKVSERCNLKCDYCYFFFAGDESWKQHPPTASSQTFEAALNFACDASQKYGIADIGFIFHGGEPLLLKKSSFSKMCEHLRRRETSNFKFRISLQTNAALVDEEWVELFAKYKVSVGVSLDGPRNVNDMHRLDVHGGSTYDATVAGLRMLQAASRTNDLKPPGLLCVANGEVDGAAVYRHFVDDLGVKSMNFLTPDFTYDSISDADMVARFTKFILGALGEWLADNNPEIRVKLFTEPMVIMLNDMAGTSDGAHRQDLREIISVSSNGDLGPEDTLRSIGPQFSFTGLNVSDHRLSDLFDTDIWREQERAVESVPVGCADCGWWACCRGGRLVNRYSSEKGFDNPSIFCSGLQEMYSAIAAYLVRSGISVNSILRHLSASHG